MAVFDAGRLPDWLAYLEGLHPKSIDMGLARVSHVRDVMGLKPGFPVLTVAGTNGKGSVCAFLTSILTAAGYKVGTHTSPHLLRYNERVMLDGQEAGDDLLVESFRAIETARGDTSLTYFEFGVLSAMKVFIDASVDVAILEVGLGGRLDAVNIFDADVASIVSIDLDHQAYLGDNREDIGREKAGVFRQGRPAICGDTNPPQSVIDEAVRIGAPLALIGTEFGWQKEAEGQQWMFWHGDARKHALPMPALRGPYQLGNAAVALAMLQSIRAQLPVALADIKRGLLEVNWPARCQVLPGRPQVVLDVAHNPHAARALKSALDQMGYAESTHAVFGMMADKDIDEVIRILGERIAHWHVAAPDLPRAEPADALAARIRASQPRAQVDACESVAAAWQAATRTAGENDRILAFGSFYTVAEVMAARGQ
ncbi:dihydrofolate synthase / folylpolyglutamate synthase [Andreprevotia lacus DSM 23236]|jgi:dihydrofolate synthase/folylpolyglutamate synthase|uniref:Dihydrofolate synthase/folylpolyglutamate synthase n=1 Tax=Andreprevotia lacus DSM 23236 TaxID=1121001 RepID=A0A1W1XI34_9NEIS|nr:bifunctional tetrahydrofolate synthase/dihydrofolate synthase [Andreprevotia lacus]SMC23653.1 dihydrofolate synthase / folylpolyglutamate synthase [Andreprevotia lacus DSM 23236]